MHQLATLNDLYDQNHSLGLYCLHCDRWVEADLADLVRAGKGSLEISRTRFRCRECGVTAEKQVRPPVPQVSQAVSYLAFPKNFQGEGGGSNDD